MTLRKRDARAIRRGIILADLLVDAYSNNDLEQVARIQLTASAFRRLTRRAFARSLAQHRLG